MESNQTNKLTTRPRVVALSGHNGTGKTTTAQTLAALTGGVIVSLMDVMREMAARALGVPVAVLRLKPTPDHLRQYLRAYGWAMRRLHGEDYWLKQWQATADALHAGGAPLIIVDDVRYLNELLYFDEQRVPVIALHRAATEPERHAGQPSIVTEVWDVREGCRASQTATGRTASVSFDGGQSGYGLAPRLHRVMNTEDNTLEAVARRIRNHLASLG